VISLIFSGQSDGSSEFTGFGGGNLNLNTLQTQQLADNLSWTHEPHSIKTGADIRKTLSMS
jgi:hypothetical protein